VAIFRVLGICHDADSGIDQDPSQTVVVVKNKAQGRSDNRGHRREVVISGIKKIGPEEGRS
jgi:hypothetical protein